MATMSGACWSSRAVRVGPRHLPRHALPAGASAASRRRARQLSAPMSGSAAKSRANGASARGDRGLEVALGVRVTYQRVAASTSRWTPCHEHSDRPVDARAGCSTASQRAEAPVTSRAARYARATSGGSAPRSAVSWETNVGPSGLSTWFA